MLAGVYSVLNAPERPAQCKSVPADAKITHFPQISWGDEIARKLAGGVLRIFGAGLRSGGAVLYRARGNSTGVAALRDFDSAWRPQHCSARRPISARRWPC